MNAHNDNRQVISLNDLVVEFASNMSLGMKAIQAAAETYVMAIIKYPTKAREQFATRFPEIRKDTWVLFEEIGNHKLPPETTMMVPGAVQKLREAHLPRRTAELIVKQRVHVYNAKTGKYNDIPFTHLTETQADIVLNPVAHSIRTVEQQKTLVKKMEASVKTSVVETKKVVSRGWVVYNGKCIVKKGLELTIDDVRAILAEMEASTCA